MPGSNTRSQGRALADFRWMRLSLELLVALSVATLPAPAFAVGDSGRWVPEGVAPSRRSN